MTTADSGAIRHKRVWDWLGEHNKTSLVMGVPQTYPVRPLNGSLVSCFLTPGRESAFAYPAVLKQEVLRLAPDYAFDVRDFRTDDKAGLLQRLLDMTETQHRVFEHLLTSKPWDFAMYVNIGVDRVHHGFWRYHDPQHRLHEPGNIFAHAIRDYYRMVDRLCGRLIEQAGDNTTVLIVSDHGAKRMDGAVCVNEWLWRKGWLVLRTPPRDAQIVAFDVADVDWTRTRAWASGGYYARVFLNVQGREPQGVIPPAEVGVARAELAAALAAIPDNTGKPMETMVFQPQQIYTEVNGVAPDLLVYFGNLHWRAVAGLGYGAFHTLENDTGPDDANHAEEGLFILYEPDGRGRGRVEARQLMDIAPTLLHQMGVRPPREMQGKAF
jgi:predicted AlkP superfamily phosphohydrolase/phosphomutase